MATWPPEWSGDLGGVQRGRSSVARGLGASQSSGPLIEKLIRPEGWLGGGAFSARRIEHTSGTEARLTRNGGGRGGSKWSCHKMKNYVSIFKNKLTVIDYQRI